MTTRMMWLAGIGVAAASALATVMVITPHPSSADAAAAADKAPVAQVRGNQPASKSSGQSSTSSWFGLRQQTITVPQGTVLPVRLNQGLSTERNNSGDTFTASLDEPLVINGQQLAPAGSRVEGVLSEVVDSGRVQGRARMSMRLQQIELNGKWVEISTAPRSFEAQATKKRDVGMIAGSAAVGAAIGAIAGGGKGAAIGAGVGGGAGTGAVLATKGKPVAFGPEARIRFTLSNPVQVTVPRTAAR